MNDVELRWVVRSDLDGPIKVLQYRKRVWGRWQDWIDVPTVEE